MRAIVMATASASRRSSARVNLRRRTKFRIRSRAALYSSSILACSGQEIAPAEGEHMKHLLKTSREKVADRRKKSKRYFRYIFATGQVAFYPWCGPRLGVTGSPTAPRQAERRAREPRIGV